MTNERPSYLRKRADKRAFVLPNGACIGGVNGSLGAKSDYTLSLPGDAELIALYRGGDCYEEVLRKDGWSWERVSSAAH